MDNLFKMVYKIVAKVLANSLRKVLLVTISDSQGALFVGRQIMNQVSDVDVCICSLFLVQYKCIYSYIILSQNKSEDSNVDN